MIWKSVHLATTSHSHMITAPDKDVENQRIYRYWPRCVEGKERCENREENYQREGKRMYAKCTINKTVGYILAASKPYVLQFQLLPDVTLGKGLG